MFIEDKEDKVFIPQTKRTITASDYNQIKNEIQGAIELAGMEPEKDVIQFPTAIKQLTAQSGAAEMEKIMAEGTKQVGIVSAAGTAQKAAVETVGAEQVSAVEAAGTAQVSKVQKEGSEQVAAAKNWASKTDGPVEEDLYSAKKYAQDAEQSAQNSRGLAIGQLVWSQSSLAKDNPGCLPAWTGEYYLNAAVLYPDFYAWVKSHPELCKTKAQYDEALSAYGECPYYVADEVAGSLRLPKLVNYIKSADETNGITQGKAGLPDHTHQAPYGKNDNGNYHAQGGACPHPATSEWFTTINGYGKDSTPASESNSIYGASDTVTPAHTTLYPWVCAYNAAVPASTVQVAEFQQALTGKANTDLSNVPLNYDYIVGQETLSDGSWYRKYKSGWLEQGGTAETLNKTITFPKPFSDTNYTLIGPGFYIANAGRQGITKTTTGFTTTSVANLTATLYWEAKGQGAN